MNQHLPPSNLRPVQWQPEDFSARQIEQFIVVRGSKEKWIDGDLFTRAQVIKEVDADYSNLCQVIAISLEAGTSRDATDEICKVVIERWGQDDEELGPEAYAFVEMVYGTAFANAFRRYE
jgi:hypothetical protein